MIRREQSVELRRMSRRDDDGRQDTRMGHREDGRQNMGYRDDHPPQTRTRVSDPRERTMYQGIRERYARTNNVKTDDEIFTEALRQKSPLSEVILPLNTRRRLLRQVRQQQSGGSVIFGEAGNDVHTRDGKSVFLRLLETMYQLRDRLEFWSGPIKSIEGTFGSGVGSYFRLLRTLLYLNVIVFLISFIFIVLPEVTTSNHSFQGFSVDDLLFGTGPLKDSPLFYGVYKPTSLSYGFWSKYSGTQSYLWTTLVGYIVYLVAMMRSMIKSYRKSFIDSAGREGNKFGVGVFTVWQMTVDDKSSANQLQEKICQDLKILLKKQQDAKKKPNTSTVTLVIRAIVSVLVLAGISALGYLGWFSRQASDPHRLIVPLSLSCIMLVLPFLISLLNWIEKYGKRHQLYIRLVQTSLLVTVVLITLRLTTLLSNDSTDGLCQETQVGQQMYTLVILYCLVNILAGLIIESVWCQLTRLLTSHSHQFDISSHTTSLVYCQMVTGLGFYYSPILPLVTSLVLILTFYLQWGSLNINYRKSVKIWTSSATRTVYLLITFLINLVPFIFYGISLSSKASDECGPFTGFSSPFSSTGILNYSVGKVILSGAVWAGLSVCLFIITFYAWSAARQKRRQGSNLEREIKGEIKELRGLQKECKKAGVKDN